MKKKDRRCNDKDKTNKNDNIMKLKKCRYLFVYNISMLLCLLFI